VRSFGERELGPHDPRQSIGGEFFTVFNIEYTFPIIGELQGALFTDAGNLLPTSENPASTTCVTRSVSVCVTNCPSVRFDWITLQSDPHAHEDSGAFHFSSGLPSDTLVLAWQVRTALAVHRAYGESR